MWVACYFLIRKSRPQKGSTSGPVDDDLAGLETQQRKPRVRYLVAVRTSRVPNVFVMSSGGEGLVLVRL